MDSDVGHDHHQPSLIAAGLGMSDFLLEPDDVVLQSLLAFLQDGKVVSLTRMDSCVIELLVKVLSKLFPGDNGSRMIFPKRLLRGFD